MRKYLQIFKISLQEEFAYRWNFIMWRVRNVFQIFLVFFVWGSIFSNPEAKYFGYDRQKILTYVLGILVVKAIVFSSRSIELSNIISEGRLSFYLIRPIKFFKYWFTRDLASKLLNFVFSLFEVLFLFLILKPNIFIQTNPGNLVLFFLSLIIALLLFFVIVFLVNMFSFFSPEAGWAFPFLFLIVFVEFLSGSVFPLDIFPLGIQKVFNSLPFSYLLFFPLQVYLGKVDTPEIFAGIAVSLGWLLILSIFLRFVWQKGIKKYCSEGI